VKIGNGPTAVNEYENFAYATVGLENDGKAQVSRKIHESEDRPGN